MFQCVAKEFSSSHLVFLAPFASVKRKLQQIKILSSNNREKYRVLISKSYCFFLSRILEKKTYHSILFIKIYCHVYKNFICKPKFKKQFGNNYFWVNAFDFVCQCPNVVDWPKNIIFATSTYNCLPMRRVRCTGCTRTAVIQKLRPYLYV